MRGFRWQIKRTLARILPKKHILFEGGGSSKKVALTFDDGPDSKYTEQAVTLLGQHGIKATFFFIGRKVEEHPEIAKKALQAGHLIGGHGYSHKRTTEISLAEFKDEIAQNQRNFKNVLGEEFCYFRPPYGDFTLQALKECINQKITTVLWSIDSRDFEKKGKEHIINNIIGDSVSPGDILLFHDTNEYTVAALPVIIEHLKKEGFGFVTVKDFIEA